MNEIHTISVELNTLDELDKLYKKIVESGRARLGFDRLALLLYSSETDEMYGSWGTDVRGNLVAEHSFRIKVKEQQFFLHQSIIRKDIMLFNENTDLLHEGSVLGQGWNAMVALWDGTQLIGWLAADNLTNKSPLLEGQKEILALYASICAGIIVRLRLLLEASGCTDTSSLQNQYDSMRKQNEMTEKLFMILAHDLRGPIGSASQLVDIVCENPEQFSPADILSFLPEIRKSLLQTSNLLQNLLDWVRGQLRGIDALSTTITLSSTLANLESLYELALADKKLRLNINCPKDIKIQSDERIIETILRNLLSNAIKYSPQGTVIDITVQHLLEESRFIIEVADLGAGIPPEVLGNLFKGPLGVGKLGTNNEKGNGLGLMFCKDLAERINAKLEAENRKEKGAILRLILPYEPEGELTEVE